MNRTLSQVLAAPSALLLDFDGPMCSIFSDYKNTAISAELRNVLSALDVPTPGSVEEEWDPLEILRWTASLKRPGALRAVEDALKGAEVRAARTAAPTPGAREVLETAQARGLPVAIVSNNSAAAVAEYLKVHGLGEYVAIMVGREPYKTDLMKPNPYLVLSAVNQLGARADTSVLIGDSLTDIDAARAAGTPVIGFANDPAKTELFAKSGADALATTMADIDAALRDTLRRPDSRPPRLGRALRAVARDRLRRP